MELEWTFMPSRNEWVLHATDWDEQWPGQATGSMCALLRLDRGAWTGMVWLRGDAGSQQAIAPNLDVEKAKAVVEVIMRVSG